MKRRELVVLALSAIGLIGIAGALGVGRAQPADRVTELRAEREQLQAELHYWSEEAAQRTNEGRYVATEGKLGQDSTDGRVDQARFDAAMHLSLRAAERAQDVGAEFARCESRLRRAEGDLEINNPK